MLTSTKIPGGPLHQLAVDLTPPGGGAPKDDGAHQLTGRQHGLVIRDAPLARRKTPAIGSILVDTLDESSMWASSAVSATAGSDGCTM